MTDDHGPSIKDDEQYEALRAQGASKEKAARIANTDRTTAAKRGGESPSYDDWTKDEMYERAHRASSPRRDGRTSRSASRTSFLRTT